MKDIEREVKCRLRAAYFDSFKEWTAVRSEFFAVFMAKFAMICNWPKPAIKFAAKHHIVIRHIVKGLTLKSNIFYTSEVLHKRCLNYLKMHLFKQNEKEKILSFY